MRLHELIAKLPEAHHVVVAAVFRFLGLPETLGNNQADTDGVHVLDRAAGNVFINRCEEQLTPAFLAFDLFPSLAKCGLGAEDQARRCILCIAVDEGERRQNKVGAFPRGNDDLLFVGVGYIPLSRHIELVLKSEVMGLQMSTIP